MWNVIVDLVVCLFAQGYEHEEFVKAAKSDDEIQFAETSDRDVAKVLFPDLKTNNVFVGLVKTEAERYTVYGKLLRPLLLYSYVVRSSALLRAFM